MRCETIREALSARIDGELEPIAPGALDRHMATCAECRSWYRRASSLHRTLAAQPEPPVPDLAADILRHLPPDAPLSSAS
ncbi:zf-HC2 domain-containing protein [Nocardia tengchongensis]|uniref:zf-HC2 domain-containing protein n=1 Tax=Nocardia tengchongensis TaxID=2055889 RepID=UPI0036CA5E8C